MSRRYSKRVADPVHGTISLTEVEEKIIDTRTFQRLRNIKQLGNVDLVFPGANYSRFSHSLGVCHIAGKILDSLKASGSDIDEAEWQRYRLAALLHDVGHYPFSHVIEHAMENVYGEDRLAHEAVGGLVVEHDPEISEILKDANIRASSVSAIFQRRYTSESIRYADIVSSGLDADRLDYLQRTAHHSGIPYGSIDFNYLISQVQMDQDGNIGFTDKARLAVDHFLLSRWFEYQQIIFHKTV